LRRHALFRPSRRDARRSASPLRAGEAFASSVLSREDVAAAGEVALYILFLGGGSLAS